MEIGYYIITFIIGLYLGGKATVFMINYNERNGLNEKKEVPKGKFRKRLEEAMEKAREEQEREKTQKKLSKTLDEMLVEAKKESKLFK